MMKRQAYIRRKLASACCSLMLLAVMSPAAHAAWYLDVIMEGQIRNAYFAGWNHADCTKIRDSAAKAPNVPKDYRDSHAEFLEQSCIKGANDQTAMKGDKKAAEKEIKYLENLFVERIPMLKAK